MQIRLRDVKSRRRKYDIPFHVFMYTYRILEFFWFVLPFLRPKYESARRFRGKVGWNKMLVNKSETLHSLSFKSSNWIELKGFEMLCGDFSYKITYTITKGRGVMGKRVTKGNSFVRSASLLNPAQKVTFGTSKRLEPCQWYTINVVIDIHEYDMNLVTSSGSDGVPLVETDCGVVIEYSAGLESCAQTTTKFGQIAGILFSRLSPQDEEFYAQERLRRRSRASVPSQVESAAGSDDEVDLPVQLRGEKNDNNHRVVNLGDATNELIVTEKTTEERSEACVMYPISPPVQPSDPVKASIENVNPIQNPINIPKPQSHIHQGNPLFFSQLPVQKPVLISQRPSIAPSVAPLGPTVPSLTPTMRTEDILRQYMHPYDRK